MALETTLFFESIDQIYARLFRVAKPRTPLPEITVEFRKYANANSRIRLDAGHLKVEISDLLQSAPAPIQEALASILIDKLFRKSPEPNATARYKRYLNRGDVRRNLEAAKQERGRKIVRDPLGRNHDLCEIFESLNLQYFHGLMARPRLGWSVRASRSTLGHYDPSHHTIVLTNLLDSPKASRLIVSYVMFHEMLHLRYPTEHRGVRRCVHTTEFKRAEATFVEFARAKRELNRFVAETQRFGPRNATLLEPLT